MIRLVRSGQAMLGQIVLVRSGQYSPVTSGRSGQISSATFWSDHLLWVSSGYVKSGQVQVRQGRSRQVRSVQIKSVKSVVR